MSASTNTTRLIAPSEVLRFLQAWFAHCPPGELVEVRPLNRRGRPLARAWCSTLDQAFERVVDCVRHGDDVYIGALPRAREGGTAEDVGSRCWLFGDVDYGTLGHAKPAPYSTREEALAAIEALPLPPTILVDTGGGFHCWYALAAPAQPDEWAEAMRRLVHALRADTNATDPPRILRVAGTPNLKVDPPRPVTVTRQTSAPLDVAAFLALPAPIAPPVEPTPATRTRERPFDRANDVPIEDVLAWLGAKPHREGPRLYCACPAHGGTNPQQMIVGGDSNSAHCFGDCKRSFTPVDLVAAARQVTPREAVNLIAGQFGFQGFSNVLAFPANRAGQSRTKPAPEGSTEEGGGGAGKSGTAPAVEGGGRLFRRGDHLEIAYAALEALRELGPITYDEGDFHLYDTERGIWQRLDVERVSFVAASFADSPVLGENGKMRPLLITDSVLRGVVNVARMVLLNDPERRRFRNPRVGLAFTNGFVEVASGQLVLRPHDPDHMCRHAYPFAFDPQTRHERLDAFLSALFLDVTPAEAHGRKAVLQEFAGACLTGLATKYQKLLVLYGTGNNGKSELLRLLRGLFPSWAIASVPPQEWGERFKASRLVGILANFVDEIPERDITTGEVFKSVVTGDPVSTERKHRDPFDFRPIAGHILSVNGLPGTVDQSDGYWRRFALCPFTRDFETASDRKVEAAKEVLERELAGLVVWALEGAARLQSLGAYSRTQESDLLLKEWREDSDPVRRFLAERDDRSAVPAATLYQAWRDWARTNGFADMSSTRFGRRVMATGRFQRTHFRTGRIYTPKSIPV